MPYIFFWEKYECSYFIIVRKSFRNFMQLGKYSQSALELVFQTKYIKKWEQYYSHYILIWIKGIRIIYDLLCTKYEHDFGSQEMPVQDTRVYKMQQWGLKKLLKKQL